MNESMNTRNMLGKIRQAIQETKKSPVKPLIEDEAKEDDNFLTRSKILMEEAEKKKTSLNEEVYDRSKSEDDDEFPITKKTPQFGDVRTSQEDSLKKTIGESIELGDKALVYYPSKKDLVLNAKINALNVAFQFRFNDPSGDGCYVWANGLQLTDSNSRTLGKVRDAFLNWKQTLIGNGDLMEKLHMAATKDKKSDK